MTILTVTFCAFYRISLDAKWGSVLVTFLFVFVFESMVAEQRHGIRTVEGLCLDLQGERGKREGTFEKKEEKDKTPKCPDYIIGESLCGRGNLTPRLKDSGLWTGYAR